MKALKILGRIALILLGVIALAALVLAGVIAGDSLFGQRAADFTNTTFTAPDGTAVDAYLALPDGPGPHPAVLMVHEWWGINAEIAELADRMAEEGYVVLAPDTYRGRTTRLIPRAIYLRVTVDEARVDGDMLAAYEHLAGLPEVDAERIGVLGFCYGGGVALRHGTLNPAIAATINLYGDRIIDPAGFGMLLEPGAGPVLGIFGEVDPSIPLAEVEAFEAALAGAGIVHTVTVYPGMGHAFVQPDALNEPGAPRDAWEQMVAFLDEHVKGN